MSELIRELREVNKRKKTCELFLTFHSNMYKLNKGDKSLTQLLFWQEKIDVINKHILQLSNKIIAEKHLTNKQNLL